MLVLFLEGAYTNTITLLPGFLTFFINEAFITKNYLARSGILPAGESLGPADYDHQWHEGEELEYGRLTMSYDDGAGMVNVHGA